MTTPLFRWVAYLSVVLLLTACGDDTAPEVEVPAWAKVAPEQIAEAAKHGVPVAFENDLGMRFVLIPAGTFRMGSPGDEEERGDDETQHDVTISKPFYLSIYEVTNGQFRHFKPNHGSFGLQPTAGDSGATTDAENWPVVEVAWDDASGFAEWLSAADDLRAYRIPTEAEWERACRAGTMTPFWWGPTATAGGANYNSEGTYVRGPAESDRWGAMPVGSFQPNPWGLCDLHGNVLEWCHDWYASYAEGSISDPHGPLESKAPRATTWVRVGEDASRVWAKARVQRGGGWSQLPRFCRSAARLYSPPTDQQDYLGFRLVSPLPVPGE